MLIGIMSDSHDNLPAIREAIAILKEKNVEKILHLGDIVSPFTIKHFKDVAKIMTGIFGNNDGDKYTLNSMFSKHGAMLSESPLELVIEDKKFLLIHGFRSPQTTKYFVESLAKNKEYDVILYGHTHELDIRMIENTQIINPGEVCGYLTGRRTVVTYDSKTGKIEPIEF
ncbi:MAG: metallophosphoesterase [Candidatus Asgardarchaeia archaeon]